MKHVAQIVVSGLPSTTSPSRTRINFTSPNTSLISLANAVLIGAFCFSSSTVIYQSLRPISPLGGAPSPTPNQRGLPSATSPLGRMTPGSLLDAWLLPSPATCDVSAPTPQFAIAVASLLVSPTNARRVAPRATRQPFARPPSSDPARIPLQRERQRGRGSR